METSKFFIKNIVEPVSHVTDAFNLLENEPAGHGAKILLPDEVLEGEISFVPVLN